MQKTIIWRRVERNKRKRGKGCKSREREREGERGALKNCNFPAIQEIYIKIMIRHCFYMIASHLGIFYCNYDIMREKERERKRERE
ncbi:MAG: hypothetical protein AB2693_33950 [Candidatus Thiodiazotropha sp.]